MSEGGLRDCKSEAATAIRKRHTCAEREIWTDALREQGAETDVAEAEAGRDARLQEGGCGEQPSAAASGITVSPGTVILVTIAIAAWLDGDQLPQCSTPRSRCTPARRNPSSRIAVQQRLAGAAGQRRPGGGRCCWRTAGLACVTREFVHRHMCFASACVCARNRLRAGAPRRMAPSCLLRPAGPHPRAPIPARPHACWRDVHFVCMRAECLAVAGWRC